MPTLTIRFSTLMACFCMVIVLTSIINNQDNVLALLAGSRFTGLDSVFVRSLKDIGLILIFFLFLLIFIINKKTLGISQTSFTVVLIFLGYCLFEAWYASVWLDLPLIVPILGLRALEVAPVALISYYFSRTGEDKFIFQFISLLRYYVLFELIIALAEVVWAPHVFGTNFLGTRPWGTFASPNTFGVAMLICGMFFFYARFQLLSGCMRFKYSNIWFFICMFLATLSGSRQAFIGVALLFGAYAWKRFLIGFYVKASLFLLLPFLLPLAYIIGSSTLISGRNIDVQGGEKRIDVWLDIIGNVTDAPSLLFGWGLGLGSNSITNVFGRAYFEGQFIADGLYVYLLSAGGILGILAYLSLLGYFTFKPSIDLKFLLLGGMTLLMGLAASIWEVFPANMLLMILWGWILGQSVPFGASTIRGDTLK